MVEVIYYVACSLDGYIATPDGALDWLDPFEAGSEDYGYARFYASIDAVLLGRRTYEQALTFGQWPYPGKPAWVFSKRGLSPQSTQVTVTDRSPREIVTEVEAHGARRAWLVGGGTLAGSFESAGLITEYIVSVIPVILGRGIPLFGDVESKQPLKLVGAQQYSDSVLQLNYLSVK